MPSRIVELASQIASGTGALDSYLQANDLPLPSFAEDGPFDLAVKSADIEQQRQAAINSALELLDLLQGPVACLMPVYNASSLQAIYRYDIASKVPVGGEISFQELSKLCNLYEGDLKRIVRFAIVFHRVFREPHKGFVGHSAASRTLVENAVVRDGVGITLETFYPSFARTVDAMDTFRDQEPNHTGFALSHNTDQHFFEYLAHRPAFASLYAGAMKHFTSSMPGLALSDLVEKYPWKSLGNATVVDVGGSEGHVSVALARAHPCLSLVVQDLPQAIQDAAAKMPTDVSGRVKFQEHDFFTEQDISADVYLFRWIFHDWPDHWVVKILRQLIPILKVGARIVVNDTLCPPPNTLPLSFERTVRSLDMLMLSLHNSRERDGQEWQRLFEKADPRFGKLSIAMAPGSALAIIESVWEG